MKEYFGIAALVVSIAANVPYALDIIKGKSKPERISWLLWTLLGLTYYFSAVISDGAKLFTFGELIGPVIIFILAIKFGVGGKSKLDIVSLCVALVAFGLLFVFDGVIVGLVLALIIDGIGAMLTMRKLFIDPTSESKSFWAMGAIASVLALVSLSVYNLENVLFPIYVLIFSSIVFIKASPSSTEHPDLLDNL